jgi:hypothetical protein
MVALDVKEEIRRRIDVRELARESGVKVKSSSGASWTAHCFNGAAHNHGDKNPSLSLYADGFKCHGCGIGGDVFELWGELYGVDFKTALTELRDRAGLSEADATGTATRRVRRRIIAAPEPSKTQDDTRPDDVRRGVWRDLWAILDEAPPTDAAGDWLNSRGIGAGCAHAYGCRDWTARRAEIVEYLRGLNGDQWRAAGLVNADGKPWYPLEALRSKPERRGLAFPVWHPDVAEHPMGIRWRFYRLPWKGGKKALGQPTPAGQSGLSVLGQPLAHESARCLYYWPHFAPEDSGGWPLLARDRAKRAPVAVLILEGETDWLAAADAMVDVETPWRILPVALCTMSAGWPDWLTPIIAGADKIICLTDFGKGDKPAGVLVTRQAAKSLAYELGPDRYTRVYRSHLLPDADDAAKHHERGELRPLILDLLGTP